MNTSLFFGFKDLVNSYPTGKSIFDLTSIILNDRYLQNINPKRYNFYVKFVNGLANPVTLDKFFVNTKEAKLYKQELDKKIAKLVELINKLNINTTDSSKIKENIANIIKDRYNLSDDVSSKLQDIMKGGDGTYLNKGNEPMQNFINVVNKELPQIQSKSIKSIDDLLITEGEKTQKEVAINRPDLINKAKKIYNSYKDDIHPNRMNIKLLDRIVFIITTFLIRFITLMIIQWGLDTNLINSFHGAFNYYCIVYLLLFAFITMFVNVIIAYPIIDLFTNYSIINIPNLFYYFYIYANGSIRLFLHITFLLIILFIPYIISVDKINVNKNQKQINISVDMDKKKKIYDTISLFSLIIWILTSIVALKF